MRNKQADIYRVALVVGILLLHAIDQGGHPSIWASNCLCWCVTGFVFISGWFGIRFSFLKIFKLYGISIYCATMFCLCECLIYGNACAVLQRIWDIAVSQWYLNAYVVLMCFSPIINEGVHSAARYWRDDRRNSLSMLVPLIVCAFGWSFATTLPVVSRHIPRTPGLTAYSFLTLVGTYAVARFFNELEQLGFKLTMKKTNWLAIIIVALPIAAVGLNDYNSPVSLILAASSFFLIRDVYVAPWLGDVCVWLGPSMFSVYLIHSHSRMFPFLCGLESWGLSIGLGMVLTYVFTVIVVFLFSLVLDMPRRIVVRAVLRFKKINR